MIHNAVITVPPLVRNELNDYLKHGGMPEDETVTYTVHFQDGVEMDIRVCGGDHEPARTEAVLYDPSGREITYSDPCDRLEGNWELEAENDEIYHAVIV